MTVNLAGVELRNPVIVAAGTCGYIREVTDVIDPRKLGAVTTKSITREPREGNPPWRMIDVPRGMLNAVGLANVGLDRFLAEKLPDAKSLDAVVIGSIAGHSIGDYVAVASAFDEADDLPLVELNVSCPNTSDGLQFGEHPRMLAELLAEIRPVLKNTKMIVKLSPNVADITAMAEAAIKGGGGRPDPHQYRLRTRDRCRVARSTLEPRQWGVEWSGDPSDRGADGQRGLSQHRERCERPHHRTRRGDDLGGRGGDDPRGGERGGNGHGVVRRSETSGEGGSRA